MSSDFVDPRGCYLEAKMAYDKGMLKESSILLEKSLLLEEHYKTRELLGACLKKMGQYQEALHNFELAYTLNPKSSKTGFLLAESLFENSRFQQAENVINQVLLNHSDYGPAIRLKSILNEMLSE